MKLKIKHLLFLSFIPLLPVIFNLWWFEETKEGLIHYYPKIGDIVFYYITKIIYFQIVIYLLLIGYYFIHYLYINQKIIFKFIQQKATQISILIKRSSRYFIENKFLERTFTIRLFYRLLAIIYLIAFASILYQFPLISENGLIPFKEFAELTFYHEGISSYYTYPSVFWLSQSNWFIYCVLIIAIISSVLSIFKPKSYFFFMLWLSYLSIVTFAREVFQFPWDTFLLEIGFLTIIASNLTEKYNYLPRILLFVFLLLFFRQWFSMGMTKLVFGDPKWYDLTYMKYYWVNHPSPSPVALWMYQLPMWLQKVFTFLALLLEMAIPIIMLIGRKGRIVAFFISFFISMMIQINGNFGFFNVLTAMLGLWCLDDMFFRRSLTLNKEQVFTLKRPFMWLFMTIILTIIFFNFHYVFLFFFENKTQHHSLNCINYSWTKEDRKFESSYLKPIGEFITHFRLVSPHGVFKKIPKERFNIRLYAKNKDDLWEELNFLKGKNVENFSFSAPNMNRLPFEFVYQSYNINWLKMMNINPNSNYIPHWTENLFLKMLERNKDIAKLIHVPDIERLQLKVVQEKIDFERKEKIMVEEFIIRSKEDVFTYVRRY